ncbi:MAG: MFS transporter [Dehalococcoidia bacterium]|nr:MFS transporter [Dehalococcoidia bacterium]
MTASVPAAKPSAFAALSYPSFRSFTLAGLLWMMADNIEHVISYWVIFEQFETPLLGGYAVISHWAPFLVGGMYMGALADRYDCRKLFIISMVMFIGVSLGWAYIFWTNTAEVWHAVVLLTLHGIAGVIYAPASQLVIHDIVGDTHLPSAIRLTATSRQLGLLLGPAVGGVALIVFGPAFGIAINALVYLPTVWWSLTQPHTGHSGEDPANPPVRRPLGWGIGLAIDSLREASSNRVILGMIMLTGVTSLLVGNAYQAQMPEYAKGFLGEDKGLVYTALLVAAALGAIVGGLVLETLPSFAPTPVKATALAVLWCLSILVFALTSSYPVALLAQFATGMLSLGFVSMSQALVQLEAPHESRGRIIGVFNMALNGLRIGSGVTVGFMGAVVGIHTSLAVSAAVLLLLMIPIALYVRRPAAVGVGG